MKRTKLLALALAGVMVLTLLTGCSDSSSKAKQVEEYFRYRMRQFGDYQKAVSYTHLTLPTTPYV